MSGGHFDYDQYKIAYIAESIEQEIYDNNKKPEYWYGEWNGQVYSDETIEEFKKAVAFLKIAEAYAQRADWLLSGDDGEESFHERLKENLDDLIKIDKYGYVKKILEK